MAFPATPLDALGEIYVNGAWVDITDDVLLRDGGVTIARGKRDEGDRTEPTRCDATINNGTGKYSPRNPTGTYFGQIGRNTPLRFSVREGSAFLAVPGGGTSAGVSTPDTGALDITGDIDVRIDLRIDNWVSDGTDLIGKYNIVGNQRSWFLQSWLGRPYFEWSANGTAILTAWATLAPPIPPGRRQAWRVTLDVNNGAGGYTVSFYYAASLAGSWTLLEQIVTTSGTTSIFNSTAPLRVGDASDIPFAKCLGQVYGAEVRNGIGGSVVANPDFTSQTVGVTSFADSAGRTWTVQTGSAITNQRVRAVVEVPSWPPRWDPTGNDVWVPITAAGILRRLGQGASPLFSTLRRGLTAATSTTPCVAYWPCEDDDRAEAIASGIDGPPMSIAGTPTLASFDGFLASAPLPVMGSGSFFGRVPAYAASSAAQVRWLLAVPAGGATAGQPVIRFTCSGSLPKWEVTYGTGGSLRLFGYDSDGTAIVDSGAVAFGVNGMLARVSIELTQNGTSIDWDLAVMNAATGAGTVSSGTATTQTFGRLQAVWAAPDRGLTSTAIGHISVQAAVTDLFDLGGETRAWFQEGAGERVARLCSENSIASAVTGVGTLLGHQLPDELVDLFAEAAATDGGVLTELRDRVGIGYALRAGRYNQPVALALDYAQQHISAPFEPTDDDTDVRNDITVQRAGGGSARAELTSGTLSTAAPPAGVGRYDDQVTLSLPRDLHCADQAWWRLHLGTWDEARYPTITIDLARNPSMIEEVAALDSGDRITISNLPAWMPPGLADLVIEGYTERLSSFEWTWTANCSPAKPWDVAMYGTARYSSAGSTLSAGVNNSATSLSVATSSGPLWTTAGGDVPFDIVIGGERMTVTAISGASSPQTFTVTRSVNGVVKSQSSGAAVELYQPAVRAL